jgi:hypothetical protein
MQFSTRIGNSNWGDRKWENASIEASIDLGGTEYDIFILDGATGALVQLSYLHIYIYIMTLLIGTAIVISLTLPVLYTRGPTFVSYYLKFGIYYLSLFLLTVLFLPYIVYRGRTADDPDFILRCWKWIVKWILGLRWDFTNTDLELTLRLRNPIKGGAVIGKRKKFFRHIFPRINNIRNLQGCKVILFTLFTLLF